MRFYLKFLNSRDRHWKVQAASLLRAVGWQSSRLGGNRGGRLLAGVCPLNSSVPCSSAVCPSIIDRSGIRPSCFQTIDRLSIVPAGKETSSKTYLNEYVFLDLFS